MELHQKDHKEIVLYLLDVHTRPGLPEFKISIPVNAVFYNPTSDPPPARYTPTIPDGLNVDPNAQFTIDLYDIQQDILALQRNH